MWMCIVRASVYMRTHTGTVGSGHGYYTKNMDFFFFVTGSVVCVECMVTFRFAFADLVLEHVFVSRIRCGCALLMQASV